MNNLFVKTVLVSIILISILALVIYFSTCRDSCKNVCETIVSRCKSSLDCRKKTVSSITRQYNVVEDTCCKEDTKCKDTSLWWTLLICLGIIFGSAIISYLLYKYMNKKPSYPTAVYPPTRCVNNVPTLNNHDLNPSTVYGKLTLYPK